MSPRTFLPSVKKRAAAVLGSAARLTAFYTLLTASFFPSLRADEPFLKKDDVIAFVGGEDLVAAAEYGYLELLLQRALPGLHLNFRSLAWEGDTVFEQRRDLNYPTLEQQLDQIGATVIICQFGQMESLGGKEKLPEFIAAYEKLIDRVEGWRASTGPPPRPAEIPPPVGALGAEPLRLELGGNGFPHGSRTAERLGEYEKPGQPGGPLRRVLLIEPTPMMPNPNLLTSSPYAEAVGELTRKKPGRGPVGLMTLDSVRWTFRDGSHLDEFGHFAFAHVVGRYILRRSSEIGAKGRQLRVQFPDLNRKVEDPLRQLIVAKNRLWYHYYRPSNWAFLAGDRTNQPSSRDHLDPAKRWFPAEMEQWLPLIDAKEKEIWALAEKLAQP